MNKKGDFLSPGLLMVGFVTLLAAVVFVLVQTSPFKEDGLGKSQSELISAAQHVQEMQIFMDTLGKRAGVDSVYSLARKGGHFGESDCGSYFGVALWSSSNPEKDYVKCYPDFEEELAKEALVDLSGKIEKLNNKKISSAYETFVISEEKTTLYGFALTPYVYEFGKEREYADRLSFTVDLNYNRSAYERIEAFIEAVNAGCSEEQNTRDKKKLDECVLLTLSFLDFDSFVEIGPAQVPTSPSQYSKDSVLQSLNFLTETNYEGCYLGGELPLLREPTDLIVIPSEGEEVNNEILKFSLSSNSIPPSPQSIGQSVDLIYSLVLHSITGGSTSNLRKGDSVNYLDFYTHLPTQWLFLDEKYVETNEKFLSQRPCEYEDRYYMFKFVEPAFYPDQGSELMEDVEYYFSFFVEDRARPIFQNLNVNDKPFDKESLLISWSHTKSQDLSYYEVFVDDASIKKIVPWRDVIIHDSFDWDHGEELPFCRLNSDGEFTRCEYLIDDDSVVLEDEAVYYFMAQEEFVYVYKTSDGTHPVRVEAVDGHGNSHELLNGGVSSDTLPYEPLYFSFQAIPMPNNPSLTQIVIPIFTPPSRLLDGSGYQTPPYIYRFYENPVGELGRNAHQQIFPSQPITLSSQYPIAALPPMLVVADHPALDTLPVEFNKLGYETSNQVMVK